MNFRLSTKGNERTQVRLPEPLGPIVTAPKIFYIDCRTAELDSADFSRSVFNATSGGGRHRLEVLEWSNLGEVIMPSLHLEFSASAIFSFRLLPRTT